MSPSLTPWIARSVACLLPALLLWGSSTGCSRRSNAQPIPVQAGPGVRSFQPADVHADARRAIGERLAAREQKFRELYQPGSIWNTLRIEQRDIDSGRISLPRLVEIGRDLFATDFGLAQGLGNGLAAHKSPLAGRHAAPNLRHVQFHEFGGPDGTRCVGCHHVGGSGGGGFRADNVFLDGDGDTPRSGLERNPRALFGAAVLQRLGEEMTADLHAQVGKAMRSLSAGGSVPLSSKGVQFGVLRRGANGRLDLTGIRGVSLDLVVRPFGWKGTATSLRQQIVTSLQQNLGIQAEELVRRLGAGGALGSGPPGDPDADGVLREATEGMVTALTAYIAALAPSSDDLLIAPSFSLQLGRGERLFHSLGCAECHVPELPLNDPVLRLGPTPDSLPVVDLTPLLASSAGQVGKPLRVRLYSDLRRHNLGDELAESRGYLGIPKTSFLTPPLWGISVTGPYLHDGRAGDIDTAIRAHQGEAAAARNAYVNLQVHDSEPLRIFLLSLSRPTQVEFKP